MWTVLLFYAYFNIFRFWQQANRRAHWHHPNWGFTGSKCYRLWGKLSFLLMKKKVSFEENFFFRDVHAMNIIHADIKPGNFLLVAGQLKLIDFGFAMETIPGIGYEYESLHIGDYWSFFFRTTRLCAEEKSFWNKGLYEPRSLCRLYFWKWSNWQGLGPVFTLIPSIL